MALDGHKDVAKVGYQFSTSTPILQNLGSLRQVMQTDPDFKVNLSYTVKLYLKQTTQNLKLK